MIAIQSVKNLNKILRSELLKQSQLQSDRVLNALSIHGEDLDKLFEDEIYVSIDKSDCILLFELKDRQSESEVSTTNSDGSITMYKSYELYCMIYGNDSMTLSNKIVARMRTDKVRQSMYESGVYIESISNPTTINEYKNNTMWTRCDFSINVSIEMLIEQVSDDSNFESVNINIKEK